MYVRPELHERLVPTQTGWFADEDIFRMDISDYSPARERAPLRLRDAAGAQHLRRASRGWGSSKDAGVAAIEAHVRQLSTDLVTAVGELGATVATPVGDGEYGPLVCVASTDPEALVAALGEDRIVTSSRDMNLRISLHLYNVAADVERIVESLAKHRRLLA